MGLVQYLVIVLMFSGQVVLTAPLKGRTYTANGRQCEMCPAGNFQKSCTECDICPNGTFTTDWNREDSCDRCFRDCRPEYHLQVVEYCTSTSNIKCVCEAGFRCTKMDPYTGNCGYCVKIQQTTTTAHVESSPLAAILSPVVVVVCVALVVLFCVRQPGDETCFKRAIAKLCNEGRRASASFKSKESSRQLPRDSSRAKQQPPPLAAANLGPVHVHNPGTVIFSLISQFTEQVGSTTENAKVAERVGAEEDEDEDFPVCHPTSSPSVHLSKEERSGEMGNIFFPSQEQGKDCHVSKEEEAL